MSELLGCPDPPGLFQAVLRCGNVDVCSCAFTVVLLFGKRCAQQNAQLSVKLSNYFNSRGVLEQWVRRAGSFTHFLKRAFGEKIHVNVYNFVLG